MEQFRAGEYHAIDELNELYGLIDIEHHQGWLLLTFDGKYNTRLLAEIYNSSGLEGIRYAEFNGYVGDGSDIYADPPVYTFVKKWGDCPSGCMHHNSWSFSVEDGRVSLLAQDTSGSELVIERCVVIPGATSDIGSFIVTGFMGSPGLFWIPEAPRHLPPSRTSQQLRS